MDNKKSIFINVIKPSLWEMAHRAGHTIKEGGYIGDDRKIAVILDGEKMAASAARSLLIARYDFYTFGGPCSV